MRAKIVGAAVASLAAAVVLVAAAEALAGPGAGAAPAPLAASQTKPCGTVTWVVGDQVSLERASGPREVGARSEVIDVTVGTQVFPGDVIFVSYGSGVEVKDSLGHTIRSRDTGGIKCLEAPELTVGYVFRLLFGRIWLGDTGPPGWQVWGGGLATAKRGTTYTIEAREDWARVRVYSGPEGVAVWNTCGTKRTVVVRPRYETLVRRCSPPTGPRRFTPPVSLWWEIPRK